MTQCIDAKFRDMRCARAIEIRKGLGGGHPENACINMDTVAQECLQTLFFLLFLLIFYYFSYDLFVGFHSTRGGN
jgi:hypothetical protein